jgi:hypothetical protein
MKEALPKLAVSSANSLYVKSALPENLKAGKEKLNLSIQKKQANFENA